jgi:hypothetical protein
VLAIVGMSNGCGMREGSGRSRVSASLRSRQRSADAEGFCVSAAQMNPMGSQRMIHRGVGPGVSRPRSVRPPMIAWVNKASCSGAAGRRQLRATPMRQAPSNGKSNAKPRGGRLGPQDHARQEHADQNRRATAGFEARLATFGEEGPKEAGGSHPRRPRAASGPFESSSTPASEELSKPAAKESSAGRPRLAAKTIRLRDKGHRKFVSEQPCVECGRMPADPHHLRFAQPRGPWPQGQ